MNFAKFDLKEKIKKVVATATLVAFGATMMPAVTAPVAAEAASAPSSVTVTDIGYDKHGGPFGTYTSSNLGSVDIHDMTANVNGQEVTLFCANHGKHMYKRWVGKTWSNPTPVTNEYSKIFLDIFYCYQKGSADTRAENPTVTDYQQLEQLAIQAGRPGYWTPTQEIAMMAYVQALVWLGESGQLDGVTKEQAVQKLAQERNDVVKQSFVNAAESLERSKTMIEASLTNHANGKFAPGGTYYRYKFDQSQSPDDGMADPSTSVGTDYSQIQDIIVGIPDPDTGGQDIYFKLKKVDGNGQPLAGATFKISFNGKYWKTITSTGASEEVFGPYPLPDGASKGSLTISEVTAPGDYTVSPTSSTINVDSTKNNTAATAADFGTFTNNKKSTIITTGNGLITKIDARTGAGVGPATFEFRGSPAGAKQFQTNANGELIMGSGIQWSDNSADNYIAPGEYTVQEVVPPPGYELDATAQHIKLWVDNNVMKYDGQLVFKNNKEHKIIIKKVDADGNPLSGAVFDLYHNDKFVTSLTANGGSVTYAGADGKGVESGYWRVVEKNPPSGYLLPYVKHQDFFVEAANTASTEHVVTFVNAKEPQIVIKKLDRGTNRPLEGAVFEVTIDGKTMTTEATPADGTIVIDYATYGQYFNVNNETFTIQVKEKVAPAGYFIDEAIKTVEITPTQKKAEFVFTDTKYPDIKIVKKDAETAATLANAQFKIMIDGKDFQTLTTDKNGEINIKYEQYKDFLSDKTHDGWTVTVTEVAAPEGYNNDKEDNGGDYTQTKQITYGQEYCEFVFEDTSFRDVKVIKKDAVNNNPLKNTTFKLELIQPEDVNITNNGWSKTGVTGDDGSYTFVGVPNGTYKLIETNAPQGYHLSAAPEQIVVVSSDSNNVIEKVFYNEPMGGILIKKIDSVTHQPIEGVTFRITPLAPLTAGAFERVTNAQGVINITDVKAGSYNIQEIATIEGYVLNKEVRTVEIPETHSGLEFRFENAQYGMLTIRKLDSLTNEPLQGARFHVYKTSGELVWEMETGQYGYATHAGLTPGSYYIKEVASPMGYNLDANPQYFEITEANMHEPHVFTFRDTPYGNLYIFKYDEETKEGIAGARFDIKRSNGEWIKQDAVTDEQGMIHVGDLLKEDTYIIKETVAPSGYILNDKEYTVQLDKGENRTIQIPNKKPGGIAITKVDANTGALLEGATFELKELDGKVIGSQTTGKNGVASWGNIEPGWYVLTETSAPEGYVRDEQSKNVQVKDFASTEITWPNTQHAALTITKRDKDSDLPLKGARFEVRTLNGDLVTTITSEANGVATSARLTPGWYHIVETKAPDGYVLNEEKMLIEIKDNTPVSVDFYNVAKKGITIHKVDALTNEPLAGAVIEIRTVDDKLVESYTTDASGTITTKALDPGYYKVVETRAPEGYVLNEEAQTIEMVEGKASVVTVKNYPESTIQVYKTDKVTGDPLAGAEFEILKASGASGTSLGFITTDKTGWAYSLTVKPGEYIVRETKAPTGYTKDATEHRVTVEKGKNVILNVTNSPDTALTIKKVDKATQKPIAGAKFELRYDTGHGDCTFIGTYITDTNGLIQTEPLTEGFYMIKEVAAADGYLLDETEHRFCVKAGQVNELVVENQALATLVVRKIDSKTGKPIAGAVFKLENADRKDLVGTLETDANGEAVFTNLKEGFYIVTETQAPPGYLLANCPSQTIHVEYGKNNFIDFKDAEVGSLKIVLQDKYTSEYLMGGQFIVTRESDQVVVFDGKTDTTGTIVVGNLIPGWYTVEQKFPPDKYTMVDVQQKVEILVGEQQTVYFKDVTAGLVIEKADKLYPTVMLEGARFQVRSNDDNIVVGEYVTGKDGLALVDGLEPGLYTVTELTAPMGYALDSKPQLVHVKEGTVAHATFLDTMLSSITINLVEEGTNKPIVGAVVEVWQQNGELIGTYTSDSTGVIQTEKIAAGYYDIKVITIPEGYTMNATSSMNTTVQLQNGIEVTQKFVAAQKGSIQVVSKNNAGEIVAGTTVQITHKNGAVVGTFTTASDGTIVVPNLLAGWYTVTGVSAPNGYTVNTTPQDVEVKGDAQVSVTITNVAKSNIVINTIEQGTRKAVAGVTIEVWQQNGNLVNTFTSDTTGNLKTDALQAGFYVLKVVNIPAGYSLGTTEVTVEVKDGVQTTQTFEFTTKGNLKVMSVNSNNQAVAGMKVAITTLEGTRIGEYTTGQDGSVIVGNLQPGWYVVTETKAPDGYNTATVTEQKIEVKSNQEAVVTFVHGKIFGLQIITSCQQTNEKVAGAVYEIRKMNGEFLGTYTSDNAGIVFKELAPGWYTVKPVSAPKGYTIPDTTARNVEVKADGLTTTEFVLSKMSSIRVQIVDGTTQKGIYNVRLQLKNGNSCIKEYYTDNEGYVHIDQNVLDGRYTLEMISAPNGYHVDTIPKSISTLVGQTTEVRWAIYKEGGQIQVVLTSADYNKQLDKQPGSLLQGGVFEVMNADTYQVVGRMISDASGIATSSGLPIGRYIVKQISGPAYYAPSDKEVEVRLKINNDVVRCEYSNTSVNMWTNVAIKSNGTARAGSNMRVDILAAKNGGDVRLDNFFIHLKVPTDAARITTLSTGSWSHAVFYNISYKTNMNDYRLLAQNLNSTNTYQYGLSTQALGLQSGEYVTDVRMEFGTVPAQFIMKQKGCFTEYVLANVYNGHKLINRIEVGGQYNTVNVSTTHIDNTFPYSASGSYVIGAGGNAGGYAGVGTAAVSGNSGQWTTASGLWTTIVKNPQLLPSSLPKTGW